MVIEGRLAHDRGRAADLAQIDSVRRELISFAGINPHTESVHLELGDGLNRARWRSWRDMPAHLLELEDVLHPLLCYPVRIEGRVPAAVLLPQDADYPDDRVEIVAALPLLRHLSLVEDAQIRVALCLPLAARAVLFDLDGTLIDSVGAYVEVARRAVRPFGLEVKEEHVRRALATGSSFWKGVVPREWSDGEEVARSLSARAAREWPQVLREHGRVFDGLGHTLDSLRRLGLRLGIVSGARPEVLELLREEGLLDHFEVIILGGDVSRSKPDPEGIFKGLHHLGLSSDEALYVGDAPVDIQASRAAGVRVVGVLTGAGDSATLSEYEPDRLIASHDRLPAIVESA